MTKPVWPPGSYREPKDVLCFCGCGRPSEKVTCDQALLPAGLSPEQCYGYFTDSCLDERRRVAKAGNQQAAFAASASLI